MRQIDGSTRRGQNHFSHHQLDPQLSLTRISTLAIHCRVRPAIRLQLANPTARGAEGSLKQTLWSWLVAKSIKKTAAHTFAKQNNL
jgi:hypothetical protein